jgi:hypothetical protein
MESLLVVLAVLACPLVMLAMGVVGWVTARSRAQDSEPADDSQGLARGVGPENGGLTRRT